MKGQRGWYYCPVTLKRTLASACVFLLCGTTAHAVEVIPRADGFARIWEGLQRPIKPSLPTFADTQDHPRRDLLAYALNRKILDRARRFHPSDPLLLQDALIWIFRTRNVDDPDDITPGTLPAFVTYHQVILPREHLADTTPLTEEELRTIIRQIDTFLHEEVHTVSFYGDEFAGDHTAFGELFDPTALTAAHRFLPANTLVRVTDAESGRQVVVRINDRGPYVDGRDMDLSRAAFEAIAPLSKGVTRVRFDRIGDAGNGVPCTKARYQRRVGSLILSPGLPTSAPVGTTVKLRGNYGFTVMEVRSPDGTSTTPRAWLGRGRTYQIPLEQSGQYAITILTGSGRSRAFTVAAQDHCPP